MLSLGEVRLIPLLVVKGNLAPELRHPIPIADQKCFEALLSPRNRWALCHAAICMKGNRKG
jgi:hypothetical protein